MHTPINMDYIANLVVIEILDLAGTEVRPEVERCRCLMGISLYEFH